MKRLINAWKLLWGKLEVEITIIKEQYACVVPAGIILKLNTPKFELPEGIIKQMEIQGFKKS